MHDDPTDDTWGDRGPGDPDAHGYPDKPNDTTPPPAFEEF